MGVCAERDVKGIIMPPKILAVKSDLWTKGSCSYKVEEIGALEESITTFCWHGK